MNVNDNEALIEEFVDFSWDIYASSVFVETLQLYDDVTEQALVKRIANNKFRYSFPSGSTVDVTIISNNTVKVEEKGIFIDRFGDSYKYSGTYYMDKIQ